MGWHGSRPDGFEWQGWQRGIKPTGLTATMWQPVTGINKGNRDYWQIQRRHSAGELRRNRTKDKGR